MSSAHGKRLSLLSLVCAIIAAAMVSVGMPRASAAEITGAITSLSVRQDTVSAESSFTLDLTWAVPDSASAGDTFTLQLPAQIDPKIPAFDLMSLDGTAVVARAVVAASGLVTFTLTAYVDSHNDVNGTAYFNTYFKSGQYTQDTLVPLTFTTNGGIYTDQITALVKPTDRTIAHKAGFWTNSADQGVQTPLNALTWRIEAPTGLTGDVTLIDTVPNPDPGFFLECSTLVVYKATSVDAIGKVSSWTKLPATRYTVNACGPTGNSVTVHNVTPSELVATEIRASLTDNSRVEYVNRGTVLAGTKTYSSGNIPVKRSNAGGDGSGLTPPPVTPDTPEEPETPPTPPIAQVKVQPVLTTKASAQRVTPGARLYDTVVIKGLRGDYSGTGTARLYGPFSSRTAAKSGPAALVKQVAFKPRNGSVRTPSVTVSAPGFYTWVASISADAHHRATSHARGLASETTLVAKPAYTPPKVKAGYTGRTVDHRLGTELSRSLPTTVAYRSVGLRAQASTVGITRGAMALPADVMRLGWLKRSAAVGDKVGTTVIAGHVSNKRDQPGALRKLVKAKKGQIITITRGNKAYRYKVTGIATHDRDSKLPGRYFSTTGAPRLVLITCTGKVTSPNGRFHYTKNLIVTATPIR